MSELQTAITNLQLKHSELVTAVKSYPGTVASAANAAIGEALVEQRKALDTVRNLRKRIEDDGQSLILDWEHNVAVVNGEGRPINEVVTFGRSTGGGRFGPDGKYEWLEADVPRIDYDPETGECRGLLVEEQRTNLYARNHMLGFDRSDGRSDMAEEPDVLSPYGEHAFITRCTKRGATGNYYMYDISALVSPGVRNTRSFLIKPGANVKVFGSETSSDGRFSFRYNIATKVTSTTGGRIATVRELGGGWFHAAVTEAEPSPTSNSLFSVYAEPIDADSESYFLACGFQTEAGDFPTSYIPTQGAAVTRAADLADVEVGDWFNPSEGAVVTAYDFIDGSVASTGHTYPGSLRQSPAHLTLGCYRDGRLITQRPRTQVGGFVGFTDESSKIGYTYDRSGRVSVANQEGSLRSSSMELVMGTTSLLNISSNAQYTRTHSGHVRSIEYHPRDLSDTELQELTSL